MEKMHQIIMYTVYNLGQSSLAEILKAPWEIFYLIPINVNGN